MSNVPVSLVVLNENDEELTLRQAVLRNDVLYVTVEAPGMSRASQEAVRLLKAVVDASREEKYAKENHEHAYAQLQSIAKGLQDKTKITEEAWGDLRTYIRELVK